MESVASVHSYLAHEVIRMDVELPRGQTRTVSLHLDEAVRCGASRIWRQLGVTPTSDEVFSQSCG